MALNKEIITDAGVSTNYHRLFWYQGISYVETDKISSVIRSFITKQAFLEGKEAVEQTELNFELPKDFNGNLREEIYMKAKELEKFKDAQDDI